MARHREFEIEQVLDKAMLLFWAQGYEATSIRDLKETMGISSSSMYEAFGDKRGVFLAVLARFCKQEQERVVEMAQNATSPHELIRTLFASLQQVTQTTGSIQGSLAFNTMVELGTRDSDITNLLFDHYLKVVDIVAGVLAQAQADNTIKTRRPPLPLAYTILSSLHGIATLTRAKPDFAHIDGVAENILSLLDH